MTKRLHLVTSLGSMSLRHFSDWRSRRIPIPLVPVDNPPPLGHISAFTPTMSFVSQMFIALGLAESIDRPTAGLATPPHHMRQTQGRCRPQASRARYSWCRSLGESIAAHHVPRRIMGGSAWQFSGASRGTSGKVLTAGELARVEERTMPSSKTIHGSQDWRRGNGGRERV
jgi:hypothetical protein